MFVFPLIFMRNIFLVPKVKIKEEPVESSKIKWDVGAGRRGKKGIARIACNTPSDIFLPGKV